MGPKHHITMSFPLNTVAIQTQSTVRFTFFASISKDPTLTLAYTHLQLCVGSPTYMKVKRVGDLTNMATLAVKHTFYDLCLEKWPEVREKSSPFWRLNYNLEEDLLIKTADISQEPNVGLQPY